MIIVIHGVRAGNNELRWDVFDVNTSREVLEMEGDEVWTSIDAATMSVTVSLRFIN